MHSSSILKIYMRKSEILRERALRMVRLDVSIVLISFKLIMTFLDINGTDLYITPSYSGYAGQI